MNNVTVTFGTREVTIGAAQSSLAVIAGPCVIESLDLCRTVASKAKAVCDELGLQYVFKASFDKANRTSGKAYRGNGMEWGLDVLSRIRTEFEVPVLTDVHESYQCAPVAEVVDILQIPAFLCRQTDLLIAAAHTRKAVNIKKGQFLAPWDVENILAKVRSTDNGGILVTERGASFGYNTLVVDMRSLPILRSFGAPVVFDATHSVQQPGGQGSASGGQREFILPLMRAALATGSVDAVFVETHPDPDHALSDAACMLPLSELKQTLTQARAVFELARSF